MSIFITIFIAVSINIFILIMYRQLDRNNRSLNKVKRYADMVKDKLSDFVESKTGEINNLAIELQVNLKTGKEILNRLKGGSDELQDKIGIIEDVKKRLNTYDTTINELTEMTEKVDENLKRIHGESEFVDGLGKRLKDASTQMYRIEKRIPGLVDEWSQLNREQLEKAAAGMKAGIEEKLGVFTDELNGTERRITDFSTYLTKLETRREDLELETAQNLEKISERFILRAKESNTNLHSEIEVKLDDFKAEVESLETSYTNRLERAAKKGEALELSIFQTLKKRIDERAISLQKEMNQQRRDLVQTNLQRIREEAGWVNALDKKMKDAADRLIQIEKNIPAVVEELNKSNKTQLERTASQLTQSFTEQLEHLSGEINQAEEKVQSFTNTFSDLEERRGRIESETVQNLEKISERFILKTEETRTALTDELDLKIERLFEESDRKGIEFKDSMNEVLSGNRQQIASMTTELDRKFSAYTSELSNMESDFNERLEKVAKAGEGLEDKAFEGVRERIEANTKILRNEMKQQYQRLVAENLQTIKNESAVVDDLGGRLKEANARVVRIEKKIPQILAELSRKNHEQLTRVASIQKQEAEDRIKQLTQFVNESNDKVQIFSQHISALVDRREAMEGETLQSLKAVSEDFILKAEETSGNVSATLEARIKKMLMLIKNSNERAKEDIKASLHQVQEQNSGMEQQLQEKINAFETDLAKLELSYKESLEAAAQRGENLEHEAFLLLKERIEANTTNLQQGIESRFKALSTKLEEGKKDLVTLFGNTRSDVTVWQAEIAQNLKESDLELSSKLTEMQQAMKEQISSLSELKAGVQDEVGQVKKQMDNALENIESTVIGKVERRLEEYEGEAGYRFDKLEEVNQDIEVLENSLREAMAKISTRISGEMDSFAKKLDVQRITEKDRTEGLMQEMAESIKSWQEEVDGKMRDITELHVADREKIERKQTEVLKSRLRELQEEFTEQKDDLILNNQEERSALKNELVEIQLKIVVLKKQLDEKSDSAFTNFERRHSELEQDFKLKSDDIRGAMEEQVEVFRNITSEIKEKAETLRSKLFGKIEEDYKALDLKLESIGQQQKEFLSQTKLFKRADTLKIELERNIGELRKNLTLLEPQKKDMQIIEAEFRNTRSLVEDTSSKLSRFQSERKRIDDLEKNYNRLVNLSQSVGSKLESITTNGDLLEEIQVKIREVESLEEEVESRYSRLEKKRNVLDSTTAGVEKNFKILENLEKKLKDTDTTLRSFHPQIEGLSGTLELLSSKKEKADIVIENVGHLDQSLSDIEERMNKLQSAREWLAKTETRLESVSKEAQDQVNLLKTLLKAEADVSKERGAPPLNKRQTVIKLAKLGWKPKEIAQTTNVSRGEVELILELAPQAK
jgi:DNA repair exonuclease SbcCD ATPase subunit